MIYRVRQESKNFFNEITTEVFNFLFIVFMLIENNCNIILFFNFNNSIYYLQY